MKYINGSSTMHYGRNLQGHLPCTDLPLTMDELKDEIESVYRYCFIRISNVKSKNSSCKKGVKKLRKIVSRMSSQQIQDHNPKVLVHCSIKLLIHSQNVVYYRESLCNCTGYRNYQIATKCYIDLLRKFITNNKFEVVGAVIDVIQEENLFEYEDLSLDLINVLVTFNVPGSMVVNTLWNKVEDAGTQNELARAIVRILYEFMNSYDWPQTQDTLTVLERLLCMYRASIGHEVRDTHAASLSKRLKHGLKVCMQRTLDHLSNGHILIVIGHMCSWSVDESICDDDVLEFGGSLEYAAFKHSTKLFEDTLTPEIFPLLMRMIASQSRLVSLLGNRVVHYLLDRGKNMLRFETPQIFFEGIPYQLNLSRYHRADKIFLKNNRAELHDSLIKGMLNHCSTRLNLETLYGTICLIAVEVPCGFTAAALVCLVMNLQDITMEREDLRREVTFHIHACIVSILSLLCWVHGAKVFYQYIDKIVMERARWAPHLNPPIQSHYSFATHHVLWDKPELFFVDWEARYGLWKCFRLLEG